MRTNFGNIDRYLQEKKPFFYATFTCNDAINISLHSGPQAFEWSNDNGVTWTSEFDITFDVPAAGDYIIKKDDGFLNTRFNNNGILDINKLTAVTVSGYGSTSTASMFAFCESLTNINLSNFDMSQVTTTQDMFSNCRLLPCLASLDTTASTNKTSMFNGCNIMVQPTLADQNALTSTAGSKWTNPGTCS